MTTQSQCPICNGPCWDNRTSKRNPRQPDFKCKDKTCNGAIWLDSKRPAHGASVPMSEPRAVQQQHSSNSYDDRSNRIERQHSQQMALMYFQLTAKLPTTQQLRDMTSWFQRDIGYSPTKGDPEPISDDEYVEESETEKPF